VNPLQAAESPCALSPGAKVTGRFRRTGPKEIAYSFTVDDPATYTQPWTAELNFYPQKTIYEYACHEGNYAMPGILAGARLHEKEAAGGGAAPAGATSDGSDCEGRGISSQGWLAACDGSWQCVRNWWNCSATARRMAAIQILSPPRKAARET
jgi:hypothetical protein